MECIFIDSESSSFSIMKLSVVNLKDILARLTSSIRNGVWRQLCPEATNNLKSISMAIRILAEEAVFVEAEVLTIHD